MVHDKNDMVKTRNGGISFSFSFIEEIDNARGDISRSCFVRRAIEQYLMDKKELEQIQTGVMGLADQATPITHRMSNVHERHDARFAMVQQQTHASVGNEHQDG